MKSLLFPVVAFMLIGAGLTFTACGDQDQTLSLHFHPMVGSEDFNLNQTYTINDVATSFTQVYFYAHDVTLKRSTASEDVLFDQYILVNASHGTYELGQVEAGSLTGISFNVGVEATINGQTEEAFTTRSEDDPLAQQDPAMHWNWATGYKFIRIEGLVDADGDGTPEEPFARHIGRNEMLRTVNLTTSKEITGEDQEIMIMVNLSKILEGSDLVNTSTIHGMDANLMDNVTEAFMVM